MFTVSFVNLLQTSLLAVCVLGILLLIPYKKYRQTCLLLVLVAIASVFNLLEELNITRSIYLVTPIFVVGFGPAIFLAIKSITTDEIKTVDYLHLLPMLLVLPFTYKPDIIIAIGTLWRIIYALLSFNLLMKFKKFVLNQRSDAWELSLNWLFWSLLIMTIVSAMNLIRLNLQPYITHATNQLGQTVSTAVGLIFFIILIKQLISQKDAFIALSLKQNLTTNQPETCNSNDEAKNSENYQAIFKHLAEQIKLNHWYRTPRLTLVQLSELTGLQVRDISRAINLSTEQNFNDYINHLRLNEVKHKLVNEPEKSILTIALDAGFNSKSSFNQIFKNQLSTTPATYRKNQLAEINK